MLFSSADFKEKKKQRLTLLFAMVVVGIILALGVSKQFSIRLLLIKDAARAEAIGNYYLNGGAYDLGKAEEAFKRTLVLDSGFPGAHYKLSRIYFVRGEFEKALESVNQELTLVPSNARTFYLRGLIYTAQRNYILAAKDFETFVQKAPKEWAGYNDLSWVLSLDKKYVEAKSAALEGIATAQNGTTNPWLFNSLGVAYLNLGEYTKAKDAFEEASRLSETLTISDWVNAYSGNDPRQAPNGLQAFKDAIYKNINKAQELENLFE